MTTKRNSAALLLLLFAATVFHSCDKARVFERNEEINNHLWDYADVKTFEAEITDTSLTYNIYVNVRHSFQFEWRNLWVDIETVLPDSTSFHKRINLQLSEPDGHWLGDCLGDNCDMQNLIQSNAYFPQPGKYIFRLRQDMRANPLSYVNSIGLRIEKYSDK
ncbi:MAG: gliding motility lipoprotein GldH [Chitinophagales bacterium]|nr:gliding motility lipoprotein GldH [Chitinophagales bacterium]